MESVKDNVRRRQRFLAFGFDLLLASGLGALLGSAFFIAGLSVAGIYLLVRDGFFQGQSVGKRIFGLRVVHAPTQQPCGFGRSLARNVLWVVPFVSIVVGLEALWRVSHAAPGRHWGDRLADTQVVPVTG